jgi:hypothetical protein
METLKFIIIIMALFTALVIIANLGRAICHIIWQDGLDASDNEQNQYESFIFGVKLLNKVWFTCLIIASIIFLVMVFKTNPLE